MSMRGLVLAGAALAATVALPACEKEAPAGAASVSGATPASVAAGDAATQTPAATPSRAVSLVEGPLTVRTGPAASAAVLTWLPEHTRLGSQRVLLVRKVDDGWVQVYLPVRPNGSTGWVATGVVRVEKVRPRITVSLSGRRMTLALPEQEPVTAQVAVGSSTDPTPTGTYYVTDRVRPDDPGGVYGAFALGLSAHSDTFSEFGSGDGQIGIHGTNEPSSIGKAVSHGCVRVPDMMAAKLVTVPLGTPVTITA